MISTLTIKGQVTLPKKFRDYLGVRPGAAVEFSLNPHGEVVVNAADHAKPARGRRPLDALRSTLDSGMTTDKLMNLLRGYDEDADDPGFQ